MRKPTSSSCMIITGILAFCMTIEANAGDTTTSHVSALKLKEVIAGMGNAKLTTAEVQQLLRSVDAKTRKRFRDDPKFLEQVIQQELLSKFVKMKAQEEGFHKRPEVRWLMDRASDQILTNHYLQAKIQIPENFPDEKIVLDAYQKNLEQFKIPAQVRLSQIFLPTSAEKEKRAEVRKQLEDIALQVKDSPSNFAALARKHSKHEVSAKQDGDMGWLSLAELSPVFRSALEGMPLHTVKGPIETPQGVHLIWLAETRDASYKSLDQVKEIIVGLLRKQKSDEERKKNLQLLLDNNPITIKKDSLSKLR